MLENRHGLIIGNNEVKILTNFSSISKYKKAEKLSGGKNAQLNMGSTINKGFTNEDEALTVEANNGTVKISVFT